jgi:hypothetical protein
MTKRRRQRLQRAPEVDETTWRYLHDDVDEAEAERLGLIWVGLEFDDSTFVSPTPRELWPQHGPEIVNWWAVNWPGTRPRCWWKYESSTPRLRVGGVGSHESEVLGNRPYLKIGIPSCGWITREATQWHPFRGQRCVGIDPYDPPKFESQAAYLDRLNLFRPGERERLGRKDFEPEVLPAWATERR